MPRKNREISMRAVDERARRRFGWVRRLEEGQAETSGAFVIFFICVFSGLACRRVREGVFEEY